MALIYGGRVLAVVDKQAARQAFAEGVTALEQQAMSDRYLDMVLNEAERIEAMAQPEAAIALFRSLPQGHHTPCLGETCAGSYAIAVLAGAYGTCCENEVHLEQNTFTA